MKKSIYRLGALLLVIAIVGAAGRTSVNAQSADVPGVIISEVQTGGLTAAKQEDGRLEFIELYNPGSTAFQTTGWRLEYLSAAQSSSGEATRLLAELPAFISPRTFLVVSAADYLPEADMHFASPASGASGLLAKSGGHIRIVDTDRQIVDMVSWGTAQSTGSWWRAPEIPAGASIQRSLPGDSDFTDGLMFRDPSENTTPGAAGARTQLPTENTCHGIELTELLANAPGVDTGREFIEIHNTTTEVVALAGCQLSLADGARYQLPNTSLPAEGYVAYSDAQTALTLGNATPDTVQLVTAEGTQRVTYPANMAEGISWAQIGGVWQATNRPTPGEPNIGQTETSPSSSSVKAAELTDCGPGKERSPTTHRCHNIAAASALTACPAGQARNPATNRCRNLASSSAGTITACKSNQERNPETNRCRNIQAATAKTCPAGQERNSQTNRCRKVAVQAASRLASVTDVPSGSPVSSYRWWIAGAVVVCALAYALYEWRGELFAIMHRLGYRDKNSSLKR